MLDRAVILERGSGTDHPVIVQIPASVREMNQWMAKQVLAMGAHYDMFHHMETVGQALNAVRAMRHPHSPGVPDFDPLGTAAPRATRQKPRPPSRRFFSRPKSSTSYAAPRRDRMMLPYD
jgi:hypothetical protein